MTMNGDNMMQVSYMDRRETIIINFARHPVARCRYNDRGLFLFG